MIGGAAPDNMGIGAASRAVAEQRRGKVICRIVDNTNRIVIDSYAGCEDNMLDGAVLFASRIVAGFIRATTDGWQPQLGRDSESLPSRAAFDVAEMAVNSRLKRPPSV